MKLFIDRRILQRNRGFAIALHACKRFEQDKSRHTPKRRNHSAERPEASYTLGEAETSHSTPKGPSITPECYRQLAAIEVYGVALPLPCQSGRYLGSKPFQVSHSPGR